MNDITFPEASRPACTHALHAALLYHQRNTITEQRWWHCAAHSQERTSTAYHDEDCEKIAALY